MKTYKEFMSEAAPLLAAPLVAPLVVGAGVKALDYVMKARKQGEGRRSQPVDYGQGGTATPRGRNVQRGRLNPNDAYNRAKREERRQEAQRRARERAEQGIDELIGSEEDRKYAKQKRQERGIDEQMVVPRSIKKKNPLMTVKTEMEILKQLSNRPGIYHRARMGKAMPPFSEERLVNVKTVGGITRGVDASTGEIKIIKGRTKREQEAVKNPPGFEMY